MIRACDHLGYGVYTETIAIVSIFTEKTNRTVDFFVQGLANKNLPYFRSQLQANKQRYIEDIFLIIVNNKYYMVFYITWF